MEKRLDLLDEKENDEMGKLVAQKLKETNNRILAWDPDEYTLSFRQQLETARKSRRSTKYPEEQERGERLGH